MNPGMFGELQAGCWGIQQEDVALDGGRRGKMVTLKLVPRSSWVYVHFMISSLLCRACAIIDHF